MHINDKAIIIVDMLNDFIDKKGALYCGEGARKIIPFIKKRVEFYRKIKGLIIYITDSHDKNDVEFNRFPPHCITGTWGSRIIPEIKPLAHEKIIKKKRYSGFFKTDLEKTLDLSEVREVEVMGVCTSICVMDTVAGLANRNYIIFVPAKGVADFNAQFHDFSLQRMNQVYGANII